MPLPGNLNGIDRPDRSGPPLVLIWGGRHDPLPMRTLRPHGRSRPRIIGTDAPPWLDTGPREQPFDFCTGVRRLCADVVARCADLAHVDVSRLLFAVTQARSGRVHGLQARVTPLRFRDGRLTRLRHGISYQVQRYFVDGREMLYLVTFCLPRFLDQDFDDKFITIFHELYHIGPQFDGDLRRHAGRCSIHTRSKRQYDAHMAAMARSYLADGANPTLHAFLRLNFAQLLGRHGSIVGVMVPRPRLLPLPARGTETPASSD